MTGLRGLTPSLVLVMSVVLIACVGPTPSPTPTVEPTATPIGPSPSTLVRMTTEQPPACRSIGQTWVSPGDGVTLVCVPAGTFEMGSSTHEVAQPRHEVRLRAFWIDRTELTNANYAVCVTAGWCSARPTQAGSTGVASKTHATYYYDSAFADYPVLIYTSEEAAAYCSCMGRRLPTEAEWEYAAGGPDGRSYPWGETLDCDHASFLSCTTDTTAVDVPLAGASAFGALNMAGNVTEWVNDVWAEGYDPASPVQDPTGPASGPYRTRRGGGWSSLARDLLVTARLSGNPAHYFDGQMGFRCAAASPP